ncbi:hypothetical protein [Variovorax sp. PAMC26660]|uniref:hypothetical protein n=1 Tax=Variovorax sp. PAMC26660 TaxID=2762322 RepID=UPI00164D06A8|nr:hypothetical protein [Variovorax sp. PAMC26660]QNK67634.1 hypothetical protein H7F35_31605 [Variovorax sp. PAMC26660]
MNYEEFLVAIKIQFPMAKIGETQSGACIWVGVDNLINSFVVQITPLEGVGVSLTNPSLAIDFSGHDEVFKDLAMAFDFIKSNFN